MDKKKNFFFWLLEKNRSARALPIAICIAFLIPPRGSDAQYQDNPLNNSQRYSVSAGLNTMDRTALCGELVFSSKGEGALVESRLGFSRELSGIPSDSCTASNNWQLEPGVFIGDGWRFGKLSLTGSLGLNLSYRRYCRIEGYEEAMRNVLLPSLGGRCTCSLQMSKLVALQFNVIGNLGFRNAYYGATIGITKWIQR